MLQSVSVSQASISLSFSLSRRNAFSPTPSIILPVLQLQFLRNEKKTDLYCRISRETQKENKGARMLRESPVNGHEAGCEGVNCVGCFPLLSFFHAVCGPCFSLLRPPEISSLPLHLFISSFSRISPQTQMSVSSLSASCGAAAP